MATMLSRIRACVFDAYGTLFDYALAAAGCREALGDRLAPLTALWPDKQLQYTWLRALQGRHADFWQVTGDALDFCTGARQSAAAGSAWRSRRRRAPKIGAGNGPARTSRAIPWTMVRSSRAGRRKTAFRRSTGR
jgi:hypothetical protein